MNKLPLFYVLFLRDFCIYPQLLAQPSHLDEPSEFVDLHDMAADLIELRCWQQNTANRKRLSSFAWRYLLSHALGQGEVTFVIGESSNDIELTVVRPAD